MYFKTDWMMNGWKGQKQRLLAWFQLFILMVLSLTSVLAHADFSFPAAPSMPMPSGCSGSAGVYTCTTSVNLNDHVVFQDAGNVTITINGGLTIGIYNIGSASQAANVTFVVNGSTTTITAPTMYANVSSGTRAINITAAPYIKGNLTSTSGSITAKGAIVGNITSTTGQITLSETTTVTGNLSSTSGDIYFYDHSSITGSLTTNSGTVTLNNYNIIGSTVTCSTCSLNIWYAHNTIGGNISVGSLDSWWSTYAQFNGSITTNGSANNLVAPTALWLGKNATVVGDVTVTGTSSAYAIRIQENTVLNGDLTFISTGSTVPSWMYMYRATVKGNVTLSSGYWTGIEMYDASTINGMVSVKNTNTLNDDLYSNVLVDSTSHINNSVFANGIIYNYGKITGCAKTSSSYIFSLQMLFNSTTGSVCCSKTGSCSTSGCVYNPFNYAVNACSSPANKFNCIDPSISSVSASSGRLYTQLVNTAFNVDLVALKSNNTVETNYVANGNTPKTVTLKVLDCGDPSTLANQNCTGSTTQVISQNVVFTSSDTGRKTAVVTVPNAYKNLRCEVTDNNDSPVVVAKSTDNFAVRPVSFSSVTSDNANADASGSSATSTPTVKAGASFKLIAATGVSNYIGTPVIDSSKIGAHSGASTTGTVAGTFPTAVSGTATGNAFTYSDVGYFRLTPNGVYDDTFTSVDSTVGDCTSGFNASGGKNACNFGNTANTNYFGRFVPDRYEFTLNSTTSTCGTRSYFGQPSLTTVFDVMAKNAAGATTQNFSGAFARLDVSSWANLGFTAPAKPASSSLSGSSSGTAWTNGKTTVTALHTVGRPTAPVSPTSIIINAKPTDADGVTNASSTAIAAASEFRFGRLNFTNAHGSELLPLSIAVEAQYWNGSAYVRNTNDSCSNINPQGFVMNNYTRNLSACETQLSGGGALVSGVTTVKLSRPGEGNNGSVNLSANLDAAKGTDKTCTSGVETPATGAGLPQFGATDVERRATFGVYKSPMIYMREGF